MSCTINGSIKNEILGSIIQCEDSSEPEYDTVNVTWTGVTPDVVVDGNSLMLSPPITIDWVHSARSNEVIGYDGSLEFNLGVGENVMAGLNDVNTTDSFTDLNYAFYHSGDAVYIYEEGTQILTVPIDDEATTRYRIQLNQGIAEYYVKEDGDQGFTLVHTSELPVVSETDYFVDTALFDANGEINNVQLITPV